MSTLALSLEDARAALEAGDWDRAVAGFEAVLADGRDPDALDGLGRAAWWQGRTADAIAHRREAYAGFKRRGDLARAVRCALWLAQESAALGNDAVARGWVARAERICEGLQPGVEHGWLALARAGRADDPASMHHLAAEAVEASRAYGDADLEIRALARAGLAAVSAGRIDEGLARFDEAMAAATGGEATALDVLGETYCDMFLAIELAGDTAGFDQWTEQVMGFLQRTGHPSGVAFCGSCCGELFAAAGNVGGAEEELLRSLEQLRASGHTARCVHPAAKLAELRIMQGRYEDAERLLEGYETLPDAVRARVALAAAHGEYAVAASLLERRLNALGADSMLSVPALAQLVEIRVAKGDLEAAQAVVARLNTFASRSGHPRVEAEAARAAGRVAAAAGETEIARVSLETALQVFEKLGKHLEAARTRVLLAQAIAGTEPGIAAAEAHAAMAVLERVGAAREADAAAGLVRALTGEGRSGPRVQATLSRREQEVLDLITEGLTNAEIAARLYISTKTAGHHVSNILMKLGVRSRAEAVAWAMRSGRSGQPA